MQPTIHFLREQLRLVIEDKRAQGHLVAGLHFPRLVHDSTTMMMTSSSADSRRVAEEEEH